MTRTQHKDKEAEDYFTKNDVRFRQLGDSPDNISMSEKDGEDWYRVYYPKKEIKK